MEAVRTRDVVTVTTEKGSVEFKLVSHNACQMLSACVGKMAMDLIVSNPGVRYNCSTLEEIDE